MKRRLGKQIICFMLSIAILVSAVPVTAQAAATEPVTAETGMLENLTETENEEDTTLQYDLNGGFFTEGYQAPETYPVTVLPDGKAVEKAGYAFDGWYENKELTGNAVTGISNSDHSGPVVLYAKWTDPYYYIDIPTGITADGEELKLSGSSEGLYADESVKVSLHSGNNWELKDQNVSLPYELREMGTNIVLENDIPVITLSNEQKNVDKSYICNVTRQPEVTGRYTDTLTFLVEHDSRDYTITYEANGGFRDDPENPGEPVAIEAEALRPGTALDNLPTAIRSGYTFLGWCYDEACTEYVAMTDRLLGDITLYASYAENQSLESHTIATFARAMDVKGDSLHIQVTDRDGGLTVNDLAASCTLTNLSDFNEKVNLVFADAANHTYTITPEGGWTEGASYKLVLDNEALYFTGFDTTIREYEISIHKEEVSNVSLKNTIKYISNKELSDLTVNGKAASSITFATTTMDTNGTVKSTGSEITGSFTYIGSPLNPGDQIAVYTGDVIPAMETVGSSESGSDIAFVEITGVNGTNYTYRGADTEDVLFMPEVLPLNKALDLDGDPENNSVTVAIADLTFGNDEMSRQLGLDADTTVDMGDFLALCVGDVSAGNIGITPESYGKITGILQEDGNYIITYEEQTWEQVQAAMDVYRTESVEGEELLEGTDIAALEQKIEDRAVESGFADEVAQQISQLVERTESYEDLKKTLAEELGAEIDIVPYAADGEAMLALPDFTTDNGNGISTYASPANKRVEVGTPQVKADIDTKLRHFEGNESGVHLELEVTVPITFHVARYADFTITVKATFEQEVRVAINVDGKAVWKTWGFIPYIADYKVTASLDLYEYTGIGLEVNFKTEEADNKFLGGGSGNATADFKKKQKLASDIQGIVDELQDMMENGEEYISDKAPLMATLGQQTQSYSLGGGEQISVAKSLAERYADLLEEESDWVEIYRQNTIVKHIRVILIIDIAIQLDFVVSANVNISLGMTFWYKNAKRYVFCLQVKGRKATSDTINITEEQYEFTAYAMGTIGIKAGVELRVSVGLLSTDLASVGISAEVGGYVQLWGYLYYILKYSASEGRNSRAMGALYLEVGIYLEIKFRAQAFANAFTYSPTLYEAMWPLYTVGSVENVLDFTDPGDISYEMKRSMRNVRVPDEFFSMNYLDLKEGLDDGEYFTKVYEDDSDKYYVISMTNDAFTYDPKTNLITVDPGEEKTVDGEMIVTWRSQPGTFNTRPYQKRIKLHWDNLRDGYYIAFAANGGSYVNPINQKYGTEVTAPQNPTRKGYTFAGWYRDEEFTVPYTIPSTMPDENVQVYAKWTPAQVNYTVKTYLQGTSGVYEIPEGGIVKAKAATESTVSPIPSVKEGFVTPERRTAVVEADGSTLIEYYYARNKYTATYLSDDEVVSTGDYRYGTTMPVPAVYKPGYEFAGWIPEGGTEVTEVPELVLAENKTYYAKWEPLTGIGYSVRYYVQDENGSSYTLAEISYLTGATGETVTAPAGNYDTASYHLKDNAPLPSGEVKADGSLELRVYYDRNTYTVTYDKKAADAILPEGTETTFTAMPGQKILTVTPERVGYRFVGWYLDEEYQETFDQTMPAKDITIYAKWERVKVNYIVRHYQENLPVFDEYGQPESSDSEETYSLVEEEVFSAVPGASVSPEVKNYEGFTSPEVQTKEVSVEEGADGMPKGTLVVEYYYTRREYGMTWCLKGPDSIEMIPVLYGAPIVRPNSKEGYRKGYHVDSWYLDEALTEEFTEDTMPAQDLKAYPKWEAEEMECCAIYEFYEGKNFLRSQTEYFNAYADSTVEPPEVKEFEGYTFDESTRIDSFKADPEGELAVIYKYHLKEHTLTYHYDTNEGPQTDSATVYYGNDLTKPDPERDGYAFAGWYTEDTCENLFTGMTMPDHDLTLYAKWVNGMQSYQVAHYRKELDGSRKLFLVENLYGRPGDIVTPQSRAPEGFAEVEPTSHTLVQGSVVNNVIIYEYDRNTYQVTYVLNGGTSDRAAEQVLTYGERLENYPNRNGYEFAGWYLDEALQEPFTEETVPARDLTLYAGWRVLQSRYIVEHYLQYNYQDNYQLDRREYQYADTDSTVTPAVRSYEGYIAPEVQQGIVSGDPEEENQLVIKYYYNCKEHQLTLHDTVAADAMNVEDTVSTVRYGRMISGQYRWGYTFGGWYRDAAYTESFTGCMPDEDLELYAKWTPEERKYTIVHETMDLRGYYQIQDTESGSAQIGSYITATPKNYPGFTAPEAQHVQIQVNSGNIITLRYSRNRHTVTFDLNGGKANNRTGNVVCNGYYGCEVNAPNPTRTGYTFIGWKREDTENIEKPTAIMQDENITYIAQWQINTYHVAFMVDGEDKGADYEYGQTITPPEEVKEKDYKKGYTFAGWSGTVPETMPAQNINLTAQWETIRYPITYFLDGGSADRNPKSYTCEDNQIVLEQPTWSEHIFLGWSGTDIKDMQKIVTIPTGVTGKRTYTAHWDLKKYTIEFRPNDFPMDPIETMYVAKSQTIQLPKYDKTPKGYTFVGWSKTKTPAGENPEVDYYGGQTLQNIGENMVLYPVFQPNKYKVTFDCNIGKLYQIYNWYPYGTQVPVQHLNPGDPGHRYGYVLKGWDKVNGSSGYIKAEEDSFELQDAQDITLKAHWDVNNTYTYTQSNPSYLYDVTDDNNKEISFTYYVDGQQTGHEVTGDYGKGKGANYIMNMDNISPNPIRQYKQMRIQGSYYAWRVIDGNAVMRISYKTTSGKEVKWQTQTTDLLDSNPRRDFDYVLSCPDGVNIEYIRLEFDANGKNDDEYYMNNFRFTVTFE